MDVISLTSQDDRLLDEDDEALSIQLSEADDYLLEDDKHSTTSSSILKVSPSPTPPSPPNGKRMIKLTKKSNSIALPLPSKADPKRKRLVRSNSFNNIGEFEATRKVIQLDDDAKDPVVAKRKSRPVKGGAKTSNVSTTLDYLNKGRGKNQNMAPPPPHYRPLSPYGQSCGMKPNKRPTLSYFPPSSSNVNTASAPVKYQTQESHGNQSHDRGQFDYKHQVRGVRYDETISPQLQARLSNHPMINSSEKGLHRMTVYEDGSTMYWDKVINVTDYSAPTLRAVVPGNAQPGLQSPLTREPFLNQLQRNGPAKVQVDTSNTRNSASNKNWKRGGKRRMISRPTSLEVTTTLNKPVPNQSVSTLSVASSSVMPVSNPLVTISKFRTPAKYYPSEVLHGFTDFHDTPPPVSSETIVNKPNPKEPYSVSVTEAPVSATNTLVPATNTSSSVSGSLAKPLESFVNKCLLHKQKYSATRFKYSGSFSVDMMKYMSPKKPAAMGNASAKPDRYYVPPSKTSTPLFGQKSTSSTPLFYRSTSKEEVATVPPSSHFSLDRLSTDSTQFKLNHL